MDTPHISRLMSSEINTADVYQEISFFIPRILKKTVTFFTCQCIWLHCYKTIGKWVGADTKCKIIFLKVSLLLHALARAN